MGELIQLVRSYRFSRVVADRTRFAWDICQKIAPSLRFFVFGLVPAQDVDDIMQETIRAIIAGLSKFQGETDKQFWAWCYRITRNKIFDHRRDARRLQPLSPDDIQGLLDKSVKFMPATPGVLHDLEQAKKMLVALKPECYDILWQRYVSDLDYDEIAEKLDVSYDSARMKITRCLDEAKKLVTKI